MTNDVTNIIAQLPAVVEALTGIDLLGTLKSLPAIKSTDAQASEGSGSGNGSVPPKDGPPNA